MAAAHAAAVSEEAEASAAVLAPAVISEVRVPADSAVRPIITIIITVPVSVGDSVRDAITAAVAVASARSWRP